MRRFVNLSSLGARQSSRASPTRATTTAAAAASKGDRSPSASSGRVLRSSLSSRQAAQSLRAPTVGLGKLSSWQGGSSSGQSGGSKGCSGPARKRRAPISAAGVVSRSSGSSGERGNSNSSQAPGSRSKPSSRSGQSQGASSGDNNRTAAASGQQRQQGGGDCGSVKHDVDGRRFILDLGDNQVAHIDYRPAGRNRLELYHTEVPSALRGRGIGKVLARGAFDCVSASNMKMKLTCSYLADYFEKFAEPKHKRLVEP